MLKGAVQKAKLSQVEELAALKRLDDQAGCLEGKVKGGRLAGYVAGEFTDSAAYVGRSVFGWERAHASERVVK